MAIKASMVPPPHIGMKIDTLFRLELTASVALDVLSSAMRE